ncbi:MAG TPA: chemotaxis-specific protein-glutamate methyltransferase CheB [Herpetosiphonaceae bacterium]|nr:chemotaxis-specific protein-glutamate methyltransferase CheB [Herpetosiphonaceae bacterium]
MSAPSAPPAPIRVLVVDDSALTRRIICSILSSDPQMQVVGEARDGREAVDLAARLLPDIITMDVHMPHVDGLQATEEIMAYTPTPILVLTASLNRHDVNVTFQMLNAGALEVLEKPKDLVSAQNVQVQKFLLERIKMLARVKVVTHLRGRRRPKIEAPPPPARVEATRTPSKLVVVGASTGGPRVVYKLLRDLPADFSAAIVVVQHIAAGFVETMVDWFRANSALQINLAQHGAPLRAGGVLVAPDTAHLRIDDGWRVTLDGEPRNLQYPSIDVTLQSAALHYPKQTIGVVLTGMGRDGAAGLLAVRKAGGHTLAQDQESSSIWGMPRAAAEIGAAVETVSADGLAARLLALTKERRER